MTRNKQKSILKIYQVYITVLLYKKEDSQLIQHTPKVVNNTVSTNAKFYKPINKCSISRNTQFCKAHFLVKETSNEPFTLQKEPNLIWARSRFHLKSFAMSCEIMSKFEISKNNHFCTAHMYIKVLKRVVHIIENINIPFG